MYHCNHGHPTSTKFARTKATGSGTELMCDCEHVGTWSRKRWPTAPGEYGLIFAAYQVRVKPPIHFMLEGIPVVVVQLGIPACGLDWSLFPCRPEAEHGAHRTGPTYLCCIKGPTIQLLLHHEKHQ